MREIKFRAWDGEKMHYKLYELQTDDNYNFTDVCIWPEGEDCPTKLGCTHDKCNIQKQGLYNRVHLMQYTGLKDVNGVEIYEGDIIGYWGSKTWPIRYNTASLEWEMYYIETSNRMSRLTKSALFNKAVVGNIYENPELLKE